MLAPHQLLRQVRRHALIHRRGLAALCLAVAVWAALSALEPTPPPGIRVWTAAADLPSGTVVRAADLQAATVPPEAAPSAAHDLGALDGRVLAGPVGAGEILTSTQMLGPRRLAGYPGRSAVPLRIPDAEAAALLRVGDAVDLVASDPQQPRAGIRIATDAVVLALPRPVTGSGVPGLDGGLVVFAVADAEVLAVSAAAAGLYLNIIWNR